MSADSAIPLHRHYDLLEHTLHLLEEPEYAALVVPNGNEDRAYHRWFHLKEGYSCLLLPTLLERLGLETREHIRIVDPFVGAGTTLISAHEWAETNPDKHVEAIGIEANPFLYALTKTKVASLTAVDRALAVENLVSTEPAQVPDLATFRDPRFFDSDALQELMRLRSAVEANRDGLAKDMRRLALATTVEPASRLRRDGRMLRFWEKKVPATPRVEFDRRFGMMVEDHEAQREPSQASLKVHLGDGRTFRELTKANDVDLVIFSPPYPNNIDYTEVYKLEAWFLGFYQSQEDFRRQRLRTLRSHPSVRFSDEMGLGEPKLERAIEKIVKPIMDAVPDDRYRHERRRMIRGYAADLASTLSQTREALAATGLVALIVGNSLHGQGDRKVLVAADLAIAEIARSVGLQHRELVIARRPARRSQSEPRLRESVLVLER